MGSVEFTFANTRIRDMDGDLLLRDLVLNITLILIFVFLTHYYTNQTSTKRVSFIVNRVVVGVLYSILGTALYYFCIQISDGSLLNFRASVYFLAAYFGGSLSAIVTFALMLSLRLAIGVTPQFGNLEFLIIEILFLIVICLIFKYVRHFVLKWICGAVLLNLVYIFTVGEVQSLSLPILSIHLSFQSACILLVSLFLHYLNQNHNYRLLVIQNDREMLEMLRMQTGFAFKIQKRNANFEYVVLEGEMLSRMGLDMKSVTENYKQGRTSILPKEKLDFLTAQYERAWQGEAFYYEFEYKGYYAIVKIQPLLEDGEVKYIIGHGLDITEHHAVKRRVQESEERYRTLERVSQDWFVGFDAEKRIVSVNQRFLDALQTSKEQVFAQRLENLITIEELENWSLLLQQSLYNQSSQEMELSLRLREGQLQHYRVHLHPVQMVNSTERIKGVFHDITDQVQRLKADEASQAKSNFLALMSHEIRTPLNGIISFTLLLQRTGLNTMQMEYLNKINSSSQSLLTLVNDILDFSKIEAGMLTIERVPFFLETFFKGIADQAGAAVGYKNIDVIFNTDPDLPLRVLGDPVRLEQILLNLLSNAIKFTEHGHVLVQAELISLDTEQALVRFVVEDTGIGIAPEHMERLFVPFTQGDPSTYRKYGGSGLGLTICYHLVSSLGGTLQVDSVQGEYSRFSFELVLDLADTEENFFLRMYPQLQPMMGAAIIEDNQRLGESLIQMMHSFGVHAVSYPELPEIAASREFTSNHDGTYALFMIDMDIIERGNERDWNRFIANIDRTKVKVLGYTHPFSEHDMWEEGDLSRLDIMLFKPLTRLGLFEALLTLQGNGALEQERMDNDLGDSPIHHKGHILVAEDHEINQLAIRATLEHMGFEVTLAADGQEVMKRLDEQRWKLIMLDLYMPEMNGFDTARKIRQIRQYDHTPILALTANGLKSDYEKCLEVGMNSILLKPINEQQITEKLTIWINLKGLKEIRGMHVEQAINQMGEKPHILQYALMKFKAEYSLFQKKVEMQLQYHRLDDAIRNVHSLKGVAANLHAEKLLNHVLELETCLVNLSPRADVAAQLERVQQEIDMIIASLPW
ncbi:response regulator [Paenibacillus xylanexedens]|uniref:response regulator n=1 Tax=Paenibacillus xylanexedens TaxID=528191 RepID=UPI001C93059C|nr:response regulator [Paenibacillus xylanexedens]